MTQLWTIASITTGEVLYDAFQTPSAGSHPKDNGWAWDPATQKATRIGVAPDRGAQAFNGTAWTDDAVRVEADLIAAVKAESSRRASLAYTAVRWKDREYAKKAQEVIDFRALGAEGALATLLNTVFMQLSGTTKRRKFIYASADAAKRGDTVADAIARFEAGMGSAEPAVASVKAIEATACMAIRSAGATAAKRAAFAAIDWTWTAP